MAGTIRTDRRIVRDDRMYAVRITLFKPFGIANIVIFSVSQALSCGRILLQFLQTPLSIIYYICLYRFDIQIRYSYLISCLTEDIVISANSGKRASAVSLIYNCVSIKLWLDTGNWEEERARYLHKLIINAYIYITLDT